MTPAKEPGFLAAGGPLFDLEHRHVREPGYFLTTIDDYQALFRHRRQEAVVGEATPHYLFHASVPPRIRHYSPAAKIVAILRSPASRSFSHYMMGVREHGRGEGFERMMERARSRGPLPPELSDSFYSEGLRRFHHHFPAEQLKVVLYDDLVADAGQLMRSLYEFLNVDGSFLPGTSKRPNQSGLPRSRLLQSAVSGLLNHRLMRLVHLRGPAGLGSRLETLRDDFHERSLVRAVLPREQELAWNNALFSSDILAVQKITGLDLRHWLEGDA